MATVVAALLHGIDLVVVAADRLVRDGTQGQVMARRLVARARNRGAVLIPFGTGGLWPAAELRLSVTDRRWTGIGDVPAIRTVTGAAFARPDQPGQAPPEASLVDELRARPAWLPALSLIAAGPNGAIIGHVLASRGYIGSAPALGLAPLSVHPQHQRRGVGSALMHAVLGAADALDEPLVALLGDPRYYRRFGFRPSTDYGIAPSVAQWQPHFQVRPLTAYDPAPRGTFTYPEPFDRL